MQEKETNLDRCVAVLRSAPSAKPTQVSLPARVRIKGKLVAIGLWAHVPDTIPAGFLCTLYQKGQSHAMGMQAFFSETDLGCDSSR